MAGKGLREGEEREKTQGFLLWNICVKTLSGRLKGVCSFIVHPLLWGGGREETDLKGFRGIVFS